MRRASLAGACPTPGRQKTNAYIKEIAAVCGIGKVPATRLARHGFAARCTESRCDYKTRQRLYRDIPIQATLDVSVQQKKRCIDRMFRTLR